MLIHTWNEHSDIQANKMVNKIQPYKKKLEQVQFNFRQVQDVATCNVTIFSLSFRNLM